MTTTYEVRSPEMLANSLFEVSRLLALTVPQPRQSSELKESEFLTLAMLEEHGTLGVGSIQRELGVMAAQMSRIIRSLGHRELPLVERQLSSMDHRRINLRLTPAGEEAYQQHRRFRVGRILKMVSLLNEEEQESLGLLLDRLRDRLRYRMGHERIVA